MEQSAKLRREAPDGSGIARSSRAAKEYPFRIHDGVNDFSDYFSVLYAEVPLPTYVEIEEIGRVYKGRACFAQIARTITELGHHIRFVAVDLVLDDSPHPVTNPSPAFTTEVVESAN